MDGGNYGRTTTRWIVALASIGSLMAALDTLVVSTALSTIRADLGASVEQLQWTINAYNLSFALLLITAVALGDRFGRRRMYASGLALFAVASAACALAPNVGLLIAGRALQGAGAAMILPLGLALLSDAFPPDRRGAAIGIFSDHWHRGRARSGCRRRDRAGAGLAVDLLAQRSDRSCGGAACAGEDA
jgi:MFS family permease